MALPDFYSYKYIAFVDASGDDGYKFRETSNDGSSFSFVVSCFVTEPKYLDYNKSILMEMKKALFVKPEQEIKSTALKRHRNADAAYQILSSLKGFAYSLIADKKLIMAAEPDKSKEFRDLTIEVQQDLSGITHIGPIYFFGLSDLVCKNDRVLIVIDNMKKREMNSIKSRLLSDPPFSYDLVFRDSKDKDFSLIQIADIFAGTIRNYYEKSLPLSVHNRFCGLCVMAANARRPDKKYIKCLDKKFRKKYVPYTRNTHFNTVIMLHKDYDSGMTCGSHFLILPVEQMIGYMYIECLILGNPLYK